jgi:hypothetical protein
MDGKIRRRFWPESAAAAIAAGLAVLTAVWPDWIEGLTGQDPDNGNGSLELYITAAFAVAAVVLAIAARAEWRRARAAAIDAS